jgi:outer membrane protein, adhesin transport system
MKMNKNFKKMCFFIGGVFFLYSYFVSANTLRDAVVVTIETNPDILYSIKTWLASEQGIYKARGGYFPKIDVVAEVGEQNSKNYFTDFTYKNYTASGAGVSLRQLVFDGFATSSLVASNKNHTLAAKYQVIGTANDIALLSAKAYLDVLTTSKLVSLAQSNYSAVQNIANIARHKGNQADINLARGRVALAKANLLAAQNNHADAETAYYKVVGTEPVNLVMPNEPSDSTLPLRRDLAIKEALNFHPMLKSAEAGINEALAQYSGSKANYYPRVDAVLRATTDNNMYGINSNQVGEEAMLQLSYNIFRGGSDVAEQKQAGYLVGQAQKSRDIIYNQIVENVKFSWDELVTAKNQLDYLKQHCKAASAGASAYHKEYKNERRSLVDVLNTQQESYQAKVNYAMGESNVLFSKYWVLNSEGRLLAHFQIPTDISSSTTVIVTRLPEVKKPIQSEVKKHVQVNNELRPPLAQTEVKKQVQISSELPSALAQAKKTVKLAPAATVNPMVVSSAAAVSPAVSAQQSSTAAYKIMDTRISPKAMSKCTIQLYSSYVKEDTIDFIIKNHIQGKAAFYLTKEMNKNKYIVVYGSYADQTAAVLELESMPKTLQVYKPIIKQLSQVQSEVST